MIPERVKPAMTPRIEPIWEYRADNTLAAAYERYKTTYQIPWVGVFALAFARHRHFFDLWQESLAELSESRQYVETVLALRQSVEDAVKDFAPPPIAGRLRNIGYSDRELDEIRQTIEIFSHGNFIQVPAAFAARHLLEGGSLGSEKTVTPFANSHAPNVSVPFIMVEPHHALNDQQELYSDVMKTLGLPFINSDYRAFARWPSYFQMAWSDLRPHATTPAHEEIAQNMHDRIFNAVADMPNPTGLTSSKLLEAAQNDGDPENLLALTRFFTWLIPGLLINVAFFRAQLEG
ncbi:MAG: hypothetical protein JKY32_03655 [Rhizobiales bacterium]|nr:hypothetical protein [Hyphomicrobiales bacterium]